jgi:hypothetical protein
MRWRQQIAADLCAAFLLAGMVALAIRAAAFNAGSGNPSVSQPTLASNENTTSWAKPAPQRLLPIPQLELVPQGDVGSLWEDGPAFDLSHEGVDY